MNPEQGATALAEQQNQFDLEAAMRQGEMLAVHGTNDGRAALTSELLQHSGNLDLAPEDFGGVAEADMPEAQLRLAMGVATEASKYGLTADTTNDDLKGLYVKMFDDAAAYKKSEGTEGYDPNVARAKEALAAAAYRKLETPAAADLSRW
jgi:hypothetical protein